jgi:hypothetical protein
MKNLLNLAPSFRKRFPGKESSFMKLISKEWLKKAKEDLYVVGEIIVRKQRNIDVDLDMVKRLDEVYISTRYPSDLGLLPSGKPSIQDAKELYEFADALYCNVKKLLEQYTEEGPENNKSNEGKD